MQTIIPSDGEIETPRKTSLPLEDFAKTLTEEGATVEVSTDPGRFVCNWI
jgi:pyrrolidone-carboxylate peptidase